MAGVAIGDGDCGNTIAIKDGDGPPRPSKWGPQTSRTRWRLGHPGRAGRQRQQRPATPIEDGDGPAVPIAFAFAIDIAVAITVAIMD